MRVFRLLVLLALAVAGLGAQTRAEIDRIANELAQITGFSLKKPIFSTTISRAQLKKYLEQQIKESVKPDEIRAEELTLKKFGLVPNNFDLRQATIDLMTEQAAAFYDYRKKRLYLLESTAQGEMQEQALVHEVAHALADQNFKLDKYMRGANQTDDGSLARVAVMEGQATWLMTEFAVRKTGMSLAKSPAMAEMAARESDSAGAAYPVLDTAPLYLRESLIFPYTAGMRFQQKVVERNGILAFGEVFRHPPATTQQIMHPERYFQAQAKPVRPPLPRLPEAHRYERLAQGGVGEFDHSILLRQYVGKAVSEEISPHWRSGFYRLWESKDTERVVLAYAVEWDSEAAAKRYFDAYRKVMAGKWKTFEPHDSPSGRVITGQGDDGYFVLRRSGARVSSIEGLESDGDALTASALDWK